MSLPKISVITITYGHEKFIEKCIEGVLMQEGNFELEFIISSDKSPDNTKDIVEKVIQKHPKGKYIKFINRETNIGIMPNFYDSLLQATGNFIALCDGDDYWTDPNKLQKQLDFLDTNKDYILVGHNVKIFENGTNQIINKSFPFENEFLVKENLIYEKNYIPALSVVFRNVNEIPNWILNCEIGDYPLILFLSQFGKIGFVSDVMANYRSNSGYHSSIDKEKRNSLLLNAIKEVKRNVRFTKKQTELLDYQCLNMELRNKSIINSLQLIVNSKTSIKFKLKSLVQKYS